MTSSRDQGFLHRIVHGESLSISDVGYFRSRLSTRIHQVLLSLYGSVEQRTTRRALAARIGRKPEQLTRWLSYPGNLTLDTISDLLVGMGYEVDQVVLVELQTGMKHVLPRANSDLPAMVPSASTNDTSPTENVLRFYSRQRPAQASVSRAINDDSVGLAESSQLLPSKFGGQSL